jgi:hypothetical protein
MADHAVLPIHSPDTPDLPLKRTQRSNWLRLALIVPFVLACYQFDWHAWRSLNCTVFVAISHFVGLPTFRVTYDGFTILGHLYRFAIACTVIDAFMGSIPLLWELGKSILANVAFLSGYFVILCSLNMLRLTLGLLIFVWGVPWWLSHEAMAGVCYFLMFLWIARRRGWTSRTA